ncbi:MAG: hypothetical protein E6K97_08230 [Thaumarchaeota archaeon]|nr:MAG: hypothetical protein E6K97_08230 [Nitrososphaerota archaeon]
MVNAFEQTPEEKEECVLDMLDRRYGWTQICKECHVSPNTISSIKKKFSGDDASKSVSQISKETQALKLFKEGWKPLDIAIELDLEPDFVFQIQKKFYQLIGLDEFNQAYHQINGNLGPFLQIINSMNRFGMNVEQILDAVKYGNALPYLQNHYIKLSNWIRHLESYRYNLHSQLNLMANQIEDYKSSIECYINESEKKRIELSVLDYQIKNMQNFIQDFDNQEGYQRIKKESTNETKSIIKNNPLLMAVTVSSTIEAIRRYPNNQQFFYDLSARQGYSALSQGIWMRSHTTQLLQLSEQVQTEIAEQITNVIMNNIRDRNDELQTSQMK